MYNCCPKPGFQTIDVDLRSQSWSSRVWVWASSERGNRYESRSIAGLPNSLARRGATGEIGRVGLFADRLCELDALLPDGGWPLEV